MIPEPSRKLASKMKKILSLAGAVSVFLVPFSVASEKATTQLLVPEEIGLKELAARQAMQLKTRPQFEVFYDFLFTDRQAESGITFRHIIVDDAGPRYKPVHYDHGNGIAAGDVDGDGRTDLYFLTFLGDNELWRNLGGGRFENITQKAGVAMTDRISVAASFADIDNDGDPDLFVTSVRKGNALFENKGGGVFEDITEASGLTYVGHSSSGVFFDYDNDGLLDLFLTNVGRYTTEEQGRGGYYVGVDDAFTSHLIPARSERSILYKNLGGLKFQDVTDKALLVDRSWSGDATPADFNEDGFQDLYVLNMQGPDHYYENVRGKFFVEKTQKVFPRAPFGAMGVKAFDWNQDGRQDLLLTDMHSDMHEIFNHDPKREKEKTPPFMDGQEVQGISTFVLGNALFENQGDDVFAEISDRAGTENYWPWGVSVDDLNADGWDDAFITSSMNFPFRYAVNSLLLNNGGKKFLDAEFIVGVEPRAGEMIQPWFELDCSAEGGGLVEDPLAGWQQFGEGMMGGGGKAKRGEKPARHPYCEGQDGRVTVMGTKGSRSSVIFDLDEDGDLDIVTTEFFDRPQVLISDLAAKKKINFLKVRLVGNASNRDGLGARVEVFHGGRSQLKFLDGKSGYLSQSTLPLYFGLGDSAEVEKVVVTWPSGEKQTIDSPKVGTLIKITEPASPTPSP